MSKKNIIKHIQYTDGSYDIEEVDSTNLKRLEEIKLHNKKVRKYIYETKKITSKYSVEQIEKITGHEFADDSLDPLQRLIVEAEGDFYEGRDAAFDKGLSILGQALSTLTEKQSYVFKMVVIQKKSQRQVAQEQGLHHKSVNEIYNAALKKLRKFFLAYPEFITYFPKLNEL